jgi:hypothetical protein
MSQPNSQNSPPCQEFPTISRLPTCFPQPTHPTRFGAFNAEAWGFTGSSRFVHDAWGGDAGFSCNNSVSPDVSPTGLAMCLDPLYPSMEFMKLGLPQHILAVDQVALPGPNGSLYVHPSPTSVLSDVQAVLMAGKGLGLSVSTSSVPEVPPSPLTSFLRHNMSLHGMVLSGYDAAFEDNLYHRLEMSPLPSCPFLTHPPPRYKNSATPNQPLGESDFRGC